MYEGISLVAAIAMLVLGQRLAGWRAFSFRESLAYSVAASVAMAVGMLGYGAVESPSVAFTALVYIWVGGAFGLSIGLTSGDFRLTPAVDYAALGICPPAAPVHRGVGFGTYTTCRHRSVFVERGNSTPSQQ